MKDRKGFTLIELLAVIIILGILMLIAIPSVNTYVNNSKKNAYIATAKKTIDGAAVKINGNELYVFDKNTTYYIPGSCIKMENADAVSPYGDWAQRYIVVTFTDEGFDYYWTSTDSAGMGVFLTYKENLDIDDIKTQVGSIPTNIGVGDRSKIVIFEDPCEEMPEPIDAGETIPDKGRYEITPVQPEPSGGEATGGSLNWSYEDFNIKFDQITNGCNVGEAETICYNATITVKNTSSTDTIKKYVASFDVPQGTALVHDAWDVDKAKITVNGTKLTVEGLNSGASWNYLTPGKSDTYSFQIKYKSDAPFTLRNGVITYTVLSSGTQTGTSGSVQGTLENMYITLPQLEVKLVRNRAPWGQAPQIIGAYDVYLKNLTSSPLENWSFVIEVPSEQDSITCWGFNTTKNGKVYTFRDNWNQHPVIQPGEEIKWSEAMHITLTDPNILPTIR